MDSPDLAPTIDSTGAAETRDFTKQWPLPIVGVAGTRGKSTIVWLLNEMLESAGHAPGLWSTAGVFVNGKQQLGELGPWSDVVNNLVRGNLSIAVQELETTVVTGVGLPEKTYPLAAISTLCGNNDDCLITPEAMHGAIAQRIVARAVHPNGTLILNADDSAVLQAADFCNASITLFALNRANPSLRRHLATGGTGVWIESNAVVTGAGNNWRPVVALTDSPFTLDGALTFQVQNLMCAVALALHLGVPDPAIASGARSFAPDPELMPGSCNILKRGGATILLDAARQVWTVRSLVRGIRDSVFRRCVVVTDSFHHLGREQIRDVGRLLGSVAQVVVTHSDASLNASINSFKDGLAHNQVPPLVFAMPNETDAIRHALRILDDGDLCLLLTTDVLRAVGLIRRAEPQATTL